MEQQELFKHGVSRSSFSRSNTEFCSKNSVLLREMHSFYSVLTLFLFLASSLQAQTFSSRKLTEISELFPKSCLPPTDSIFACPQITKGKSYIVRYNPKNEIKHLGVSLFSPETKEMISLPICNFIERIMLELLLHKSQENIQSKLREYKIKLQKNGVAYGKNYFTSLSRVLDDIQDPTRFAIRKDSLTYTALWEFGNDELLSLSFPASRELIFGTDKKESDQNIGESFVNNDDCVFTTVNDSVSASELSRLEGTDLYVRKGNIYLTEKINSDTYYQRSDDLYQAVFDAGYPAHSLANLFITKQFGNDLNLKITHRMYGSFTPEFTIPLEKFFCLFDAGFSTYCILHRAEIGKIHVSVVLHNRDFNYIHLLRIRTSIEQLFTAGGILTADFYTNIPQHNLKSLF